MFDLQSQHRVSETMGQDQSLPLLPLGDEEPSFRLLEEDGDNHLLNFFHQNDELATVTTNMLMMVFDDTDDEKEESSSTAKKKRKAFCMINTWSVPL